jgi:hypothetical protein
MLGEFTAPAYVASSKLQALGIQGLLVLRSMATIPVRVADVDFVWIANDIAPPA